MARIRSVHPGLFTDAAFMALSCDAQIFLVGLWTEADDQGVFKWEPVTLRARIRPAKDGASDPILSELEAGNLIRSYEIGGRKLGAIRNFRRFQRPKFPNTTYQMTDDIRSYVGLSATISEMEGDEPPPLPPQVRKTTDDLRNYVGSTGPPTEMEGDELPPFPRIAEKSPQMEDGGGRREDGGESKKEARARTEKLAFEGRIIRLTEKDFHAWTKAYHTIPDLSAELAGIDDKLSDDPPKDFRPAKWFSTVSAWLRKKHARLLQEVPAANGHAHSGQDNDVGAWRTRIKVWLRAGTWSEYWSLRDCPASLIEEYRAELFAKPPPGATIKPPAPMGIP